MFLAAVTVAADMVTLKDGSRLVGRIEQIADNSLKLVTGFAGTLQIPFDQVAAFSSDEPISVALESGNTLVGKVSTAGEQLTVNTAFGEIKVTGDKLAAAWVPGAENPTLPKPPPPPPPRQWNYELGVDVAGSSGNTDSERLGIGFKADLTSPTDSLKFFLNTARATENKVKTTNKTSGGVDYESRFAGKNSWYVRAKLETDKITDLELRTVAAFGYGYYFIDKPDTHVLRGRIGTMYKHESYKGGANDTSSPGLDLGLYNSWRINESMLLVSEVSYTPTFDDMNDYNIFHTSALDVPIIGSDAWKLRLGLTHELESMPAPGVKKLDTTWFGNIIYSF